NDVLDQFGEKLCAGPFLVARFRWLTSANDFIQLHPLHQAQPVHAEKTGERTGFVANEKILAFRRERIFSIAFVSNSRPSRAFMIARNPRVEAPVFRLTSSIDFGPRARVSKTLFETAAPIINGGA